MKYFWLFCIAITLPMSANARFAASTAATFMATNAAVMAAVAASAAAASNSANASSEPEPPAKCVSVYEGTVKAEEPGTPESWAERQWPDKEVTTIEREEDEPFYRICHLVNQ